MTLSSTTVRTAGGLDIEVLRGGHGIKVVYLPPATGVTVDAPFVQALADRFEVFAVVAPGTHDPTQLDHLHSVHDMALVYDDVLAALGLTNVPVVGHGTGATLAAELAAHAPARVAKLVLLAPPPPELALVRRLYRIDAPTRVIIDEVDDDAPVPTVAELAAGIASCDTEVVAGAGDVIPVDRIGVVLDAVEAHVRGKAPGARDGLLIKHVDDLPWHEVRVMMVNGVRSVVKNRFIDFGEHRTICHTWYDPGIALAKHSHFAEELIYVLSGGIHIGDVWCPEGTAIVLEPGTYFGPIVAGPEGAYLLESFPGIGVRSGQDRAGFDELAARLGIEPLADPPFNPPVTT
jgi:pimeloyl-ACP methyl ester carboxylesterase